MTITFIFPVTHGNSTYIDESALTGMRLRVQIWSIWPLNLATLNAPGLLWHDSRGHTAFLLWQFSIELP